jgi:hypothetical protein
MVFGLSRTVQPRLGGISSWIEQHRLAKVGWDVHLLVTDN